MVFGAAEGKHQPCTLNNESSGQLIWVSDFQQYFQQTSLATVEAFLWFPGMSVNTEVHSNASLKASLCREAWCFYVLSDSGSCLLADVHACKPFSFFPSAASQPPMLWHLIYILISHVQDRACKNTIQIVPGDRKVHSEHKTDVLWRCRAQNHHIFTDIYQTVYSFPGLGIVRFRYFCFFCQNAGMYSLYRAKRQKLLIGWTTWLLTQWQSEVVTRFGRYESCKGIWMTLWITNAIQTQDLNCYYCFQTCKGHRAVVMGYWLATKILHTRAGLQSAWHFRDES